MRTYLFDASAVVELYNPQTERNRKVIDYIVDQRRVYQKAALLIPSFCIVEVFNTLAKMHSAPPFGGKPLSKEKYKDALTRFREDIRWGKTFYSYELNRYHILAADEIILVEYKLAPQEEKAHLSSFDILVIAMACELAYLGDRETVSLVTRDRRMRTVTMTLKNSDRNKLDVLKVERALGEPPDKRWVPLQVLYIPEVGRNDIEHVDRQGKPNF